MIICLDSKHLQLSAAEHVVSNHSDTLYAQQLSPSVAEESTRVREKNEGKHNNKDVGVYWPKTKLSSESAYSSLSNVSVMHLEQQSVAEQ